ncbi:MULTISPECIES: hypothetical protein [unclassified Paenibacillus]|uniref:hypothetical protein n=1 Tax=unclassified Paenibacillus TaxID=185978 RepID=UPI00041E6A6D|nr:MULTISPECIES: hypothetical protein [unclassified Paenibacillus]KGP83462.1 hypothetical protein P364_0107825 [Paenibacillus sp. MAEPY2]KGP86241.1 hypothetical protein P363_0118300 [Paenibacillus sp. MAEPY1]
MRKLNYIIGTVTLMSIIMMGCNESKKTESIQEPAPSSPSQLSILSNQKASAQEEQQALEMTLEYKKAEFAVDNTEDEELLTVEKVLAKKEILKPFLTERNLERYSVGLPFQVADKEDASLHAEDIKAKIKESKNDWMLVEYTLNLVFTNYNGEETKTIPLEGEITFLQEQGEWRIQDDTYNMKAFLEIINKSL